MAALLVLTATAAGALLVSVAVLVATLLSEPSRRLSTVRAGCLALTGALVAIGVARDDAPWLVGFASLGLMLALRAELGHRLGQSGPAHASEDEPAWWPDFEREFAAYVARDGRGDRSTAGPGVDG